MWILLEIENYYRNLYQSTNDTCDFNLNDILTETNITKLNDTQRNSLEGDISYNEATLVLKNMSNNKSPGSDGFTAEFFKVFWKQTGNFVIRSLNLGYKSGELSITQKQGIITCIPKDGKSKFYMKNWRPISLLNVVYKIGSGCIAHRIKTVISSIISTDQNGFVPGRYIGENTRLIYDLMRYTENHNIPGLLLMIDFEKAFDTVSWKFIDKTLQFFNFGPSFRKWISVFQQNISSSVSQAGHLSSFFKLGRGCRQGDPVSSYIFLLCVEILALKLKNNQDIKGINIDETEYLLSQYADDTLIILDGSEKSLTETINELNNFYRISGLKINVAKTQLVWIGSRKYSSTKLCTDMNFQWLHTFKLLGINFDVDLANIPKLNYDKKLVKIKHIINQWSKRHTTPLGRITLIKSLLISQFNHLFISLPSPSNTFIKNLNEILFNFLWQSKVDKLKRKQVIQDYVNGGLKMTDISNYILGLKSSWIKRILYSQDTKWKSLLNKIVPLEMLMKTGSEFINAVKKDIKNNFWIDTFSAFQTIQDKTEIQSWYDLISQPIWNNNKIKVENKTIFYKKWFKNNIVYISDLLDENGSFLSLENLQKIYKIKTNFLIYASLQNSIKSILASQKIIMQTDNPKPFIPFNIKIFCTNKKGTKHIYNTLIAEKVIPLGKMKWGKIFEISDNQWGKIYSYPFHQTKNSKLQWLQFRINNYILTTNSFLSKIGKVDSKLCSLCKNSDETILHLLWDCPKAQDLIQSFLTLCNTKNVNITLHRKSFIFGISLSQEISIICLIIKSYIYRKRCRQQNLSIQELIIDIKTHITTLKYTATQQSKYNEFMKQWNNWLFLLDRP